jgi:large subunit ribosomal protein L4
MKIDVINLDGATSGQVELPDDIFGIEEIRGDILQRCVTWQLAKRRAGTHKIQVRNEVSRTGKKMYRQKGTGGARHGSRRAAQFVGGAKAHGPVVRSHEIGLPKKVRALALRHALSSKAKSGDLVLLETATLDSPKTAALRANFASLGWKNALVIAGPQVDGAFGLAARNIPNIDVLPNAGLNVYDILRRNTLVLTKAALDGVVARFAKEVAEPEPAPAPAPKRKAAAPKATSRAKPAAKAAEGETA